jgi:hypothetical protein
VSANLFLGQYIPDLPGLDQTAKYRELIMRSERWLTAYFNNGYALSVRRWPHLASRGALKVSLVVVILIGSLSNSSKKGKAFFAEIARGI